MAPSRRYFGRASSRFQRSSKSTLAPAVLLGVILLVQIYFAGALLATASSHLSSSASFYDLFHCVTSLGIAGVPFVAVHRDVVDNTTRPNLPVFVVVKTVPAAYERRAVMRETWLKELRATMRTGSHDIEYRFFSEEPSPSQQEDVQAECEKEGDLVIIHNVDQKAHRKIGVKMVRSFKWVVEKYNVSHVVMVDDDSYVNLKRFKGDWPTWGTTMHYLGFHMLGMKVIKVPRGHTRVGKYGEHYRFPVNAWPRYASGPFYALSADLLEPFINPSLPLRDMSSNDAMTGAVLLPYPVHYEISGRILYVGP